MLDKSLFYGTLGAWSSGRSAVPRSCGPAVHAGGAASVVGVELARELGGGQHGRAGGAGGVAANGGKPNVLERVSGLVELMLRQIKNTASDDFLGRLRDPALDDGGLMIRPEDGARGEFGEDALGALRLVVARVGGVALGLADGGGGVWDGAGGGGRGGGGAVDGSQVDEALRDLDVWSD
jgi:hypothetical protein